MPLSAPKFPDNTVYGEAATQLEQHLAKGQDVAVLCEGDPFFYGSLRLFARMAERHAVEVVPGVSSPMACAAVLGAPLAAQNDILTILLLLPSDQLKARLEATDAAAIIKLGRHFERVRTLIAELTTGCARYIERNDGGRKGGPARGRRTQFVALLLDDPRPPAGTGLVAMNEPAIIVLTANGQETAKRISAALPDAEIFVRRGRAIDGTAFDDTGEILRNLFTKGRTIIGVCAAGILIRLLAPVLNSKRDEPPVLAVSEDGAVVIPLLGGHRGGNRLAAELAETLGGQSAITTASDRRFGVALDDPPSGWVLSNPADANAFLANLLDGAAVQLHGTADWVTNSDLPLSESGDLIIEVAETPTEGGRTISCITSATWQLALVASAIHRPMK